MIDFYFTFQMEWQCVPLLLVMFYGWALEPVLGSDVFASMYEMEKLYQYELDIQEKISQQLKDIDAQLNMLESHFEHLYKVKNLKYHFLTLLQKYIFRIIITRTRMRKSMSVILSIHFP